MDLGISGRTAIVMGGSRGLGLSCAKLLASEGVNVVIGARAKEPLTKAEEQISKIGSVMSISADIHKANDRTRIIKQARKAFGAVDILIVNTPGGVAGFKSAIETTKKDWSQAIKCKFNSAIEMCRQFYPKYWKENGVE